MSARIRAPASVSSILLEPWLTLRWVTPTPPHRRYSQCLLDIILTIKLCQLCISSSCICNFSTFRNNRNRKRFAPLREVTKTKKQKGSKIRLLFCLVPKFLMTPSSLAGCLDAGTPPSHSALRSTSHQLASGTGIGVYSGSYPKSQSYYNTSDATALYSRVSCTFHFFDVLSLLALAQKSFQ